MKGTNTIQLNEATVIEAVQEYIDKRWTGTKLKVSAIRFAKSDARSGGYDVSPIFEVTLLTEEVKT